MDARDPNRPLRADAATPAALAQRGRDLLEVLSCRLRPDGAWPALPDPPGFDHRTVSTIGSVALVVGCFAGPLTARRTEVTGVDLVRPDQVPQTRAGRPLGSGDRWPYPAAARRAPGRGAPLLAHGIDPVRSLRTAARLVTGAYAGVAFGADDACHDLPDLPGHEVLTPGSGALLAARARIGGRRICGSFLWPVGGPHAHGHHVQVTALVAPVDTRPGLVGLVLVSPPPDLHGLTPRELEVLGLLVEGCSNAEVASTLVIAPRTAAAHLEHVLLKLDAPTRTLAAVRAEQQGLYVPTQERQRLGVPGPRQGR